MEEDVELFCKSVGEEEFGDKVIEEVEELFSSFLGEEFSGDRLAVLSSEICLLIQAVFAL